MIIQLQFKEEINKKLGYESDYSGVKATSYRTQRAEKGVFFEIMVSRTNIYKNKVVFSCLYLFMLYLRE